ncbi:hypothetical protein PHYPSEUDO_012863 [Phytophthora pseudosyringae]|uniref:Uncharacterized protein n=1 Tax=Phytophthora pseudosyringae TaxID=221518 RepID=A0A8T1V9C9_9STRA|nr:hypothetical protein PHYPSEUDO_012863 [Phytophthora pseudosyringae]
MTEAPPPRGLAATAARGPRWTAQGPRQQRQPPPDGRKQSYPCGVKASYSATTSGISSIKRARGSHVSSAGIRHVPAMSFTTKTVVKNLSIYKKVMKGRKNKELL